MNLIEVKDFDEYGQKVFSSFGKLELVSISFCWWNPIHRYVTIEVIEDGQAIVDFPFWGLRLCKVSKGNLIRIRMKENSCAHLQQGFSYNIGVILPEAFYQRVIRATKVKVNKI